MSEHIDECVSISNQPDDLSEKHSHQSLIYKTNIAKTIIKFSNTSIYTLTTLALEICEGMLRFVDLNFF